MGKEVMEEGLADVSDSAVVGQGHCADLKEETVAHKTKEEQKCVPSC